MDNALLRFLYSSEQCRIQASDPALFRIETFERQSCLKRAKLIPDFIELDIEKLILNRKNDTNGSINKEKLST